ncbi:MAG TPA: hypothetical protein PLL08_04325, partial [Bacteroidales bacterium]|nr:hypothetical protein [Bacteroidales bacterium]
RTWNRAPTPSAARGHALIKIHVFNTMLIYGINTKVLVLAAEISDSELLIVKRLSVKIFFLF